MTRQKAHVTRRNGKDGEDRPQTKAKFLEVAHEVEVQQATTPRFEAKNPNQKLALSMLKEGRSVIFLAGSAGVGKSMIAAYHAATQLKAKKIEKVYLVRPAVSVGKSIGLLPGTISEKMTPFFAQTLAHLAKFMGSGYLKYCLEKEIVVMLPAEYMRGMSLEGCICISEESQNFTKDEFEMVLTRMGQGAQIIFTGDQKQHDLRGLSGIEETLDLLDRMKQEQPRYLLDEDLEEINSNIGVVRFTPDDVVRSGLTRALVKMYYNNN
jgi:phosphate starvation-inducible PhoH-like protein